MVCLSEGVITEQSIAFLYFEELSVACAAILVLLIYLFYVRYPCDKDILENEDTDE